MNTVRYRLKAAASQLPLRVADAVRNLRLQRDAKLLLVARHPAKRSYTYRDFFRWVEQRSPELRYRLKFCLLPHAEEDWASIGAVTFWLPDSIDVWSPSGHRQALELERRARSKGVSCLNSIDTLATTVKSVSTRIWNEAGLRAPRCHRIRDAADVLQLRNLSYPLLVRDDYGHGRPAYMIHEPRELSQVAWDRLHTPMAAEFIETRSPMDGLYRKYRAIVAGDRAVPRHLLANPGWEVRPKQRLASAELLAEELRFVAAPCTHSAELVRAARLLGLDIAGIDYSFTPTGELVLWEANPTPNLNLPPAHRAGHLLAAVERSFAAVAELYLNRLGVASSPSLAKLLSFSR